MMIKDQDTIVALTAVRGSWRTVNVAGLAIAVGLFLVCLGEGLLGLLGLGLG